MDDDVRYGRKKFQLCPECHTYLLDKATTPIGWLCCLSCWWICCFGCCCLCCCRADYCEQCHVDAFNEKAKERRITQLHMEDKSLLSQPSIDDAVKEEQPEVLLMEKKDK